MYTQRMKRLRFRFSLEVLFLLLTAGVVWLGFHTNKVIK